MGTIVYGQRKAREQNAKFDENRRARKLKSENAEPYQVCAIKIKARTGGGEGKTRMNTACPEGR